MCDLTQEFKLCSCDGENLPLDQIGWVLVRMDAYLTMQSIVGMPANVRQITNSQINKGIAIADFLNNNSCFDFDYQPKEYDFLRIRSEKGSSDWYAFVFVEGKWKVDKSVPLHVSSPQLKSYKNGTIYQEPKY